MANLSKASNVVQEKLSLLTLLQSLASSRHGAVPPGAGSAQAGDRPNSCAVSRHEVTAAELLSSQCASCVLTSG